jgi:hypothetical protein
MSACRFAPVGAWSLQDRIARPTDGIDRKSGAVGWKGALLHRKKNRHAQRLANNGAPGGILCNVARAVDAAHGDARELGL